MPAWYGAGRRSRRTEQAEQANGPEEPTFGGEEPTFGVGDDDIWRQSRSNGLVGGRAGGRYRWPRRTKHSYVMDNNAIDRLLTEVEESSSRSLTLAPAECAEVVQAKRVSENDWRLTLEGTPTLADRLEAVVQAAPDTAQATCRTVGPQGRHHVRLEIGCRGPHVLASLLEAVIEDHSVTHPDIRLTARLQVDDAMRPRRIDLLVPSGPAPQSRNRPMWPGSFGLVPAQTF